MARKDDGHTLELPGVPKRRGRPPTGKAKSNAQRQAAYRARRAKSRIHLSNLPARSPANEGFFVTDDENFRWSALPSALAELGL